MIISADERGCVIVNEVTKVAFVYYGDDRVLIKPEEDPGREPFVKIACQFINPDYPQGIENDTATLLALGSEEDVIVF